MKKALRKENKYRIGRSEALLLQHNLEGFLQRDKNAGPLGEYRIRSQYYDSAQDRDFLDNLDGAEEKRKIRVRIYGFESPAAKLEYKCKSGSDGVKYEVTITREEAERLERGDPSFLLTHEGELPLFLYQKFLQGAYGPRTIVEYDRIAYTCPVSETRITFDRNIRGSVFPVGLYDPTLAMLPLTEGDLVVLEIKYNDFLPEPVRRALLLDRLPEANSKYSMAREQIF